MVTHLAGNAKQAIESADITKLIVTNTFPVESLASDRIEILSLAKEMAAILRPLVVKPTAVDGAAVATTTGEK